MDHPLGWWPQELLYEPYSRSYMLLQYGFSILPRHEQLWRISRYDCKHNNSKKFGVGRPGAIQEGA